MKKILKRSIKIGLRFFSVSVLMFIVFFSSIIGKLTSLTGLNNSGDKEKGSDDRLYSAFQVSTAFADTPSGGSPGPDPGCDAPAPAPGPDGDC